MELGAEEEEEEGGSYPPCSEGSDDVGRGSDVSSVESKYARLTLSGEVDAEEYDRENEGSLVESGTI